MDDEQSRLNVPVVAVGASAGGLEAIRTMLRTASDDVGMAFVIIQHLDPEHDSMLAEILSRQTTLPVHQVSESEKVRANNVYIIPPGSGLRIEEGVLHLAEFEHPRGQRRPIDDFFESLGHDQGPNAACVILSGTGADGTAGLRVIKQTGGLVVAQDPDTARYDGMPVSAVGTGLVDFVRDPSQIIETLTSYFDRRRMGEDGNGLGELDEHLDDICAALRESIGHDFTLYKRTTLMRRVERRMQVLGIHEPVDYLYRVKSDHDETEALFRDLLINVTRFFRDPEAFDLLRSRVIRPLVESASKGGEIRVWVPGCSSGEEAYSIAMLFADAMKGRQARPMVQIFATDIDDAMLQIAREGKYPATALNDIPEPLRSQFTVASDHVFHIAPKVRDMIRFSSHSLIKDPPFSKLDLVSCRNLLIYFDERLQQQVFPILHYAIRPGGYLFLGPSESIGRHEHMFSTIDQKARLFERLRGRPIYPLNMPASVGRGRSQAASRAEFPAANRMRWEDSISVRRIVDRYAPASMVVDAEGEVVSSNGRLAKYFELPRLGSTTTTFAVTIARPGLKEVLLPLLRQAFDQHRRIIGRDITVQAEFGTQKIDVIADPLPDGTALLVFRDSEPFEAAGDDELAELGPADGALQQVEEELRVTRHRLRTTVEELETANEELKSSNEEMMSMNEELQSTNEELSTVNDELSNKVDLLSVANADLQNFFASTELPVIVLDPQMKIRSFTEAATEIFPLQPGDKGRSLSDVSSSLQSDSILDDARVVLGGSAPVVTSATDAEQKRHWSVRITPYKVLDGTVDGVTIVFSEITEALSIKAELNDERERLNLAVQVAGIGIWEYNIDTGAAIMDDSEQALLGLLGVPEESMVNVLELIMPADRPLVEESLRRASAGIDDFRATFRIKDPTGEVRTLRGLGRLVPGSRPRRIVGVTYDITPEARLADQREYMIREMNHRVKNLFAIISGLLTTAARTATTPVALAESVRSRILALGRAHNLTQEDDRADGVELKALVSGTLEPYEDVVPIRIEGDRAKIHSSHLTPLALILHEWTTNAYKYGVLGPRAGSLAVRWQTDTGEDGVPALVLEWIETIFEPTMEPESTEKGFGSRLVAFSVAQLEATIETSSTPQERRITLRVPSR